MVCSYITYLFLRLMLPNSVLSIIAVIFCISSWLLVAIFSPVEDYHKPFSKEEYKKFKIVGNIAIVTASGISFALILFLEKEKWGFSIAAGICVVSLSLIAGTVKNKLRKRRK